MAGRVIQLVTALRDRGPISAAKLAEEFGVSTRTIRSIVSEANEAYAGTMRVVSHRGQSYRLEVEDAPALERLLSGDGGRGAQLPSRPEERQAYLLADLVSRTGWITLDELCNVLYVSKRTLSNDLRVVKEALSRFGLTLESKPYHGVKVFGDEAARRICLASVATGSVVGRPVTAGAEASSIASLVGIVASCVDASTAERSFRVDELAHHNLIVHIAIAVERIRAGQYVPMRDDQLSRIEASPEFDVARAICARIEERLSVHLPREEVAYVALHLAGKRSTFDVASSGSLVISDDAWNTVTRMLEHVLTMFKFDLRDDIELHMNLARHVMPLFVRLRNHMSVENPLLDDIRSRFPLAWAMAYASSKAVLVGEYGAMPSDDEVGYIALSFALSLERRKSGPGKKSILVVCATGAGTARLLEYRYRKAFGDQIASIETCDVSSVAAQDFTKIDYVFTTVPLSVDVPVPVHEVSLFPSQSDIDDMRSILDAEATVDLTRYFDERLFFAHLDVTEKEQALDYLCERVVEVEGITSDLRASVRDRERLAPTAFGNMVAMPHPMVAMGARDVVCVGVLDHSIEWNGNDVSVVFMLILARDSSEEPTGLLETLSSLFVDERAIRRLVDQQRFELLMSLLQER